MTWSSIQNKGSGCITNHTFLGLLAKIKCIVSVLISLIFDRWGKSDYDSLVPGFSRVALVLDCSLGWHTPSKTNLKFIMFAINQSKLDFFYMLMCTSKDRTASRQLAYRSCVLDWTI